MAKRKFTKEHRENLKKAWDYKKHITDSWREKQSQIHKGKAVTPKGSKWSKKQRKAIMLARSKWTDKDKENRAKKISKSLRGDKAYQWRGGITKLSNSIRRNHKSRDWSKKVLKRDNHTCQACKKIGGDLHAHHVIEFSEIISKYKIKSVEDALRVDLMWDVNNGTTLCKKCHRKTYKFYGNQHIDEHKNSVL